MGMPEKVDVVHASLSVRSYPLKGKVSAMA